MILAVELPSGLKSQEPPLPLVQTAVRLILVLDQQFISLDGTVIPRKKSANHQVTAGFGIRLMMAVKKKVRGLAC